MIERLAQFIQSLGLSVRAFELSISASDGMIRRAINNKSDIQSKWITLISDNYPQLSLDWLITGKGPMLRDNKAPEESKRSSTPITTPISRAEESIIYKMYKDEKEEKEKLVKEKEAKIDQLQAELRSQSEELAALKASHQNFHSHGHHDQPDNTEGIHKGLGQ